MSESGEIRIEERGLFVMPKGERRARRVVLFRIRIIEGSPHICFIDSYNSRKGRYVEVEMPFHQLIEQIHRFIVVDASKK